MPCKYPYIYCIYVVWSRYTWTQWVHQHFGPDGTDETLRAGLRLCLCLHLFQSLSISLCLCLSVSLSLCLCLSLSLSVCLMYLSFSAQHGLISHCRRMTHGHTPQCPSRWASCRSLSLSRARARERAPRLLAPLSLSRPLSTGRLAAPAAEGASSEPELHCTY